nr:MAG TPA: hypothetical protein [Caudoviricetes sp.]
MLRFFQILFRNFVVVPNFIPKTIFEILFQHIVVVFHFLQLFPDHRPALVGTGKHRKLFVRRCQFFFDRQPNIIHHNIHDLLLICCFLLVFQHIGKNFVQIICCCAAQLCRKNDCPQIHPVFYCIDRRTVSPVAPSHADCCILFRQFTFHRLELCRANKTDCPCGMPQSNVFFSVDNNSSAQLVHRFFVVRIIRQRNPVGNIVFCCFLFKVDVLHLLFRDTQHCGQFILILRLGVSVHVVHSIAGADESPPICRRDLAAVATVFDECCQRRKFHLFTTSTSGFPVSRNLG